MVPCLSKEHSWCDVERLQWCKPLPDLCRSSMHGPVFLPWQWQLHRTQSRQNCGSWQRPKPRHLNPWVNTWRRATWSTLTFVGIITQFLVCQSAETQWLLQEKNFIHIPKLWRSPCVSLSGFIALIKNPNLWRKQRTRANSFFLFIIYELLFTPKLSRSADHGEEEEDNHGTGSAT